MRKRKGLIIERYEGIANNALLKKQNISDKDENKMNVAYICLFSQLEAGDGKTMVQTKCAEPEEFTPFQRKHIVRMCEFRLQGLWKFDTDENYHSYWFQTIGCKCPVYDNMDMVGTKLNYTSSSCQLHCESNFPEKRIAIADLMDLRQRAKARIEEIKRCRRDSDYWRNTIEFLQFAIKYYSIEIKKMWKLIKINKE